MNPAILLRGTLVLLIPTVLARIAHHGSVDAATVLVSAGWACAYALLALGLHRGKLWPLTIAWLGLPLLQFSLFWLQWIPALLFTGLWGAALWHTARHGPELNTAHNTTNDSPPWMALALLLAWVYLSGAGGYGLQKDDYILHTSRLVDLVTHAWPVHFIGEGRWYTDPHFGPDYTLMVQYSAYYLPAAFIGKWLGQAAAFEAIHLWTLLGTWLAWRWLMQLSGLYKPALVALILIFFAGWDAVVEWQNIVATVQAVSHLPMWHWPFDWAAFAPHAPLLEPNFLDFWPTSQLKTTYFFGHYPSTSAQLFWAPHQTLAGWLTVSVLACAWREQRAAVFCFCYALLALWSPMNLIALALFPLCFVLRHGWHSVQASLSWQNAVAGSSILLVLGLYYTSASALSNPGVGWLWQNPDLQWRGVGAFHLMTWGVYTVAIIASSLHRLPAASRQLLWVLCASLLLLPLYRYGEYSDLVTRGSASLMFLLLALLLQCVALAQAKGKRTIAIGLLCLLLPGIGSGVLSITSSALRYNQLTPPVSVSWYGEGWLFMGRQSSVFGRWLAEQNDSSQ